MRTFQLAESPFIVFIVFLLIYLFTLTSNFTAPHDSMAYLNMLKTDEGLWHPHHLLYHVSSKYWLHFWKLIFPSSADYIIVESYSSVWGAALLALVFIFFRRRFELSPLTSWLCTAVVGLSYGIWFYSVNVEVYMPALFFTLLSLYTLSRKEWSSRHVWRISIVHALAILFHQMNILLVPVVIYKIATQRKNIYIFKSFFWYGLTGLVLVGGTYFLAGWVIEGNNNFTDWVAWIRGYTESNTYWQPFSWKTPFLAAMGFLRTIVGGQFIFRLGSMQESIGDFLKVHALQDEAFLVKGLSPTLVWTALIMSFLLGVVMLILLVQFIARFREKMRSWKHVIMPLLLYAGIYTAYFLFWMPEILEFWLGHCIVLWLLLLGTYRPAGRRLNIYAGMIAGLLFVINYTTSIKPMQSIENDIGYARIEKVRQTATENDLVVVQDPWLLKEFLEYYTKARVRVVPEKGFQQIALKQDVDSTVKYGHRVFIFPSSNIADASENKNFIPALQKEYADRMKTFQEELSPVLLIE
jgi:hypothetical protein